MPLSKLDDATLDSHIKNIDKLLLMVWPKQPKMCCCLWKADLGGVQVPQKVERCACRTFWQSTFNAGTLVLWRSFMLAGHVCKLSRLPGSQASGLKLTMTDKKLLMIWDSLGTMNLWVSFHELFWFAMPCTPEDLNTHSACMTHGWWHDDFKNV